MDFIKMTNKGHLQERWCIVYYWRVTVADTLPTAAETGRHCRLTRRQAVGDGTQLVLLSL